jgi:hypothetical protein
MSTAQRNVQVIGRATPTNLRAELAALEVDFRRGREREPEFRYDPALPNAVDGELCQLADRLDRLGDPLADLYAARARELALEHRLCCAVGTASFWALARRRYRWRDQHDSAADTLARAWLAEGDSADHEEHTVTSDDDRDPRSLISRMRREIGARRLPVRVVATERLSALAATGHAVIFVAAGRKVRVTDVERTVLHEIEGHALPRQRSEELDLTIFRIGTAYGSDDQEGRALAIEEQGGWLDGQRRRELARRHVACRMVESRIGFVDVVRELVALGTPLRDALRVAARAHRGGGLAREAVYLPGYLRVSAALGRSDVDAAPAAGPLAAGPLAAGPLAAGRVAVDAAEMLRDWVIF